MSDRVMHPLKMRLDVMLIDVLPKKVVKKSVGIPLYFQLAEYDVSQKPPQNGYSLLEGNVWKAEAHEHIWLKATVQVPALQKGERAGFILSGAPGNPQFLVHQKGKIVCGLDNNHKEVYLEQAGEYEIYIYAYTNAASPTTITLSASLAITDENTEKLYYDLLAPWQVLEYTEEGTKEFEELLYLVNDAVNMLDLREYYSENYQSSVEKARRYLEETVYGRASQEHFGTVTGIGHTHIDVQWLWRYQQTREKAVRSFSTVLYLMDRYPEYKFMSSQAELYKIVKELAPDVYERIKQRVKEGRWEVEGAMWLEADCNLTSGESLVRQILYGKNFFKEEFGVDSKILWLPDVFGYSAALPQILKKSGVDTFVTSKISWSDTNRIPYDTFEWKGIDGTEIFTYFLTAQSKVKGQKPVIYTTYVAMTDMAELAGTYERYQQKNINDEVLTTFGWGDGGGGPTADMLEKMARASKGVPFAPKAQIDTATNFIARVKENVKKREKYLPTINGELYLEFHRGTYTTNGKIKRQNRKAEFALQNAELYSTLANTFDQETKRTLDDCWHEVLNNQFHDVLPGSSIADVYKDTDKTYEKVFADLNAVTQKAMREIGAKVQTDEKYLVFNPTSYTANAVVETETGEYRLVENIPPKGYKTTNAEGVETQIVIKGNTLENEYYVVEINESGEIVRLYDKKAEREVLESGKKGNVLEVHQDLPNEMYDAWDIKAWHDETVYFVDGKAEITPVFQGNRAGVKVKKSFCSSTVEQYIWLYDGCPRIDFETKADWQEKHTCVKVNFPTVISATKATYEIQFGNVERPTTKNNSWEEAKFEVCAQKWADVSESDWGVSLMNDCKYGYETSGGDMRLTLFRTPNHPGASPKGGYLGEQEFTYSIYCHKGQVNNSDTQKQATLLNNPPVLYKAEQGDGTLPKSFAYVSVADERVAIDSVKKAESGDGVIVRAYETTGARVKTKLLLGTKYNSLYECDLLENPIEQTGEELVFKPFEIKTILVK